MATNTKTESKKPVHSIRLSPIQVSIWENPGKDGKKFHSVTWSRTYKSGEEYKHTQSVSRGNISNLITALELAKDWIEEKEGKE